MTLLQVLLIQSTALSLTKSFHITVTNLICSMTIQRMDKIVHWTYKVLPVKISKKPLYLRKKCWQTSDNFLSDIHKLMVLVYNLWEITLAKFFRSHSYLQNKEILRVLTGALELVFQSVHANNSMNLKKTDSSELASILTQNLLLLRKKLEMK